MPTASSHCSLMWVVCVRSDVQVFASIYEKFGFMEVSAV